MFNFLVLKKYNYRKFGMIGGVLVIVFFVIVLMLGLVQPEYDHLKNTISELVLGQWGYFQNINFGILILSGILVGCGLNKSLKISFWPKLFFGLVLVELLLVLIFPSGTGSFSIVHLETTNFLLLTMAALFWLVIRDMKKDFYWNKNLWFSYYVLFFNLIGGLIWFYLEKTCFGGLVNLRGISQKILVMNVLVWLVLVGWRSCNRKKI